jgi:anti-sigma regulatory factor (Ser/Thr protein kinase)
VPAPSANHISGAVPSAEGDTWAHETVLAGENVSVARARDFVRGHLVAHDLPFLEGDMLLVVSELASNAVQHARTDFTVNLSGDDSSVILAVRDDSPSDPFQLSPSGTRTRGRGLALVDRLTHDWGVEHWNSTSKSVWARFLTS